MVKNQLKETSEAEKKKEEIETKTNQPPNRGQLKIDATCAPADISYPTDLGILNTAREQTEKIIDILYSSQKEKLKEKPRTYRQKARKDYLEVAKRKRPSNKQRRKAIGKQLQYLKRNLNHLDRMIALGLTLEVLSKQQYKRLLVVTEIYRQQELMWSNRQTRIDDRIVSIFQPHIRPIVRGKAGKPVEFGAKLSASCFDGYVFLDRISWDNFNESVELKKQVEAFKKLTGVEPESVHVDKIYRTRENRAWCKAKGIRISGIPLGRPPASLSKESKKQFIEDERIRNEIEGKFGVSKRRFSLNRVMTKLDKTTETSIAITFLVMNLVTLLRQKICRFFVPIYLKKLMISNL